MRGDTGFFDEKERDEKIDLLYDFLTKFNPIIISSRVVEDELSNIKDNFLFANVTREYLKIRDVKKYITKLDETLADDLVAEFTEAGINDILHLTAAVCGEADVLTSFNKDFLEARRNKIYQI